MLAKIWKKLLLAICIIAILFDITIKLVNRISLEKAISSTPNGVNLREVLNITDEQRTPNHVDNVSRYKTVEEVEAERATRQEVEEQKTQEYLDQDEQLVEEQFQEEKSTGGKIIDKVTDSITNVKKYDNLLN